jgi:glycosyltransferase involved in cell wall biosynthesis
MKNGRILFLAPTNPMGIGGGCFAAHAYLRALSEICEGSLDIVMADSWHNQWDNNIKYNKIIVANPLSFISYALSIFTKEIQRFSRTAIRAIEEHPDDYSLIVSNGSSISGKLYKVAKKHRLKLVTIHHNYEPEYFSDNSKGLHRIVYLPIVRKLEELAYRNSDFNFFLTKQDQEKFHKEYGIFRGKESVIGVFEFSDNVETAVLSVFGDKLTFVITGSLCTMQGVDGIKYFFEELYQYLPQDCNVIISGRNPQDEVKFLCDIHKNVKLIPNPANMSEVISSGDIYICPTRVGGGIKLRVMDGLRLGLPVITHTCSARGYDIFFDTPYLKSFTNQEEFKNAIEEMVCQIRNYSKADVLEKYNKCFSYKEGLARMRNIFESIC